MPSPVAHHRIVDDERGTDGVEDVSIGASGGHVTYSRGSLPAKLAVRAGGVIVTTAGGIGVGLGIAAAMVGMCSDSSCADARETGGLFLHRSEAPPLPRTYATLFSGTF